MSQYKDIYKLEDICTGLDGQIKKAESLIDDMAAELRRPHVCWCPATECRIAELMERAESWKQEVSGE